MKPIHLIKAQRARLMLYLAVRCLAGELTSEQHHAMCKRVEKAYNNTWRYYANVAVNQ